MAGLSGPQLQDQLARLGYRPPIVFLTGHGDIPTTVRAIKAGADDFLTKPVSKERLLEAIERALLRCEEVCARDSRIASLRLLVSRLTPREHEVFALITTGLLNKQVGAELGTTERTVKAHRASIMTKMGADSLADLVRMAGILQMRPPSKTAE